ILAPVISDRIGRKPALILFSFTSCVTPIIFALFHWPLWAMLFVTLVSTGAGVFPLFMVIVPSESIGVGIITTAIALVQLVGELFGGTVMPTVAGVAADEFGISAPIWIAIAGAFAAGIVSFGLKETAPSKNPVSAESISSDVAHDQ